MSDFDNSKIVQNFIGGSRRYLELALEIEEAVEALRSEATTALEKELNLGIAELSGAYDGDKWHVTETPPKGAKIYPDFLRRLYKSDGTPKWKGDWAGIRVERWDSHRITIQVRVEGWPSDDSAAVHRRLAKAFETYVDSSEDGSLWRSDKENRKSSITYSFNADTPCIIGCATTKAQDIVKLLRQLLRAVDGGTRAG